MLLVQKIEQSCYHIKTTYSYHMDIHAQRKVKGQVLANKNCSRAQYLLIVLNSFGKIPFSHTNARDPVRSIYLSEPKVNRRSKTPQTLVILPLGNIN